MPTLRDDGTPMYVYEIASYDLTYIGRNTGASGVIHLSQPSQTRYVIQGLAADQYDFSISSNDVYGIASDISNVVTVNVK